MNPPANNAASRPSADTMVVSFAAGHLGFLAMGQILKTTQVPRRMPSVWHEGSTSAGGHCHVRIGCGSSGCRVPTLANPTFSKSARLFGVYAPARKRLFMRSGKWRFLKRSMTS